MGQVYRAFDSQTNREVALKVLPSEFATNPDFRERFQRESNLVAGLREPHIIPIHAFGEIDGQLFLDMRLIDGVDARTILTSDGPMKPERAVAIVDQTAAALDAAHAIGLEHRDIKPGNILVAERDFVYLIDFGIARAAGETGLTSTGLTIGTFAYMAPERFGGGESDHRSDVYSLTCVLYELVTGSTPYPGKNVEQQIAGHLHFPPPAPTNQAIGIPAGFDAVIARGMAKNPEERFQSAGDLAAAAIAALTGPTSFQPTLIRRDSTPASNDAPTLIRPGHEVDNGTTGRAPVADPADRRPQSRSKRAALVAAGTAAIVIVAAGTYVFFSRDSGTVSSDSPLARLTPTASVPGAPATTSTMPSNGAETAAGKPVQVVGLSQIDDNVYIRVHNPNANLGLIRSGFELTLLDASGAVLSSEGQGGIQGTPATTIYQLPPSSDYGFSVTAPSGKKVASVELITLGKWHDWRSISSPSVTVSGESIKDPTSTYGPTVVGRLALDSGDPSNVTVLAFVDTDKGLVVASAQVDCVQSGQKRSFEAGSYSKSSGPYKINKVVAYPNSVAGIEPSFPARC